MKVILFFFLVTVFTSCHYFHNKRIHGDGNVTRQNREVTGFSGVEIGGAIHVIMTQDSSYKVDVEIDNNLHQYIAVYKDGDILQIHPENNTSLDITKPITVYVSAPVYKLVRVSGASSARSTNKITEPEKIYIDLNGASKVDLDLQAPVIDMDLNGASTASLRGNTKNFSIDASGSSDVNAFELLSENADLHFSGAGQANVFASVRLNADATGASKIRYRGNPSVTANTSGAGSVEKEK